MDITIIGSSSTGGGGRRTRAVNNFLQTRGYEVNVFYHEDFQDMVNKKIGRKRYRLDSHTINELVTDEIEDQVKKIGSSILICIENGDILRRNFSALKIYFCSAPAAHEMYFALSHGHHYASGLELKDIEELKTRELAVFKGADYVLIAWNCYEQYIKRYAYNGDNIVSNPYGGWAGCDVQERPVSYSFPPSIIYLGSLERYWVNMDLLSYLSDITPNVLDVYGTPQPDNMYGLNYKGRAATLDVFYDYQFGLNTVSKEILRRYGFSCKVFDYLSYGLPCLFPEWQKFPHELGGCIPYNEDNFTEVVDRYSEQDEWQRVSKDAIEQARELSWDKVLQPLLPLIQEKG